MPTGALSAYAWLYLQVCNKDLRNICWIDEWNGWIDGWVDISVQFVAGGCAFL